MRPLFDEKTFDLWKNHLAKREIESLQRVRFAIVYRYSDNYGQPNFQSDQSVEKLLRYVGACLRLIRPMEQDSIIIRGRVLPNTMLDVHGFQVPGEIGVPAVQKLFRLRNRDLTRLQKVVPLFMVAVEGKFWKFRMSLEFHDWGHFMHSYWKARFSLWCSALEALFTSNSSEHKGSLVAKERIKWFLGPKTLIYEPGDTQVGLDQPSPTTTIEDVIDDLYELRNSVAHGDKTPDKFFVPARSEYGQDVTLAEVLNEAASRIIRASLLRILEDNLLNEFADGPSSETYFGAHNLTRSKLKGRP